MGFRHQRLKKEHSILGGAKESLQALASAPDVERVILGRIRRGETSRRGLYVTVQYPTAAGLKLIVHCGASQEVFVVTKKPDDVRAWIEGHLPMRTDKAR